MAKMVLTASYLALNSVDYSDHTKKIKLMAEVDEKDVTTFASLGWVEVLGGLKKGSLEATFTNDIADNNIDETLWGLLGTVTTYEVRLTNSAVSTSNPKYTGSVLVKSWTPISGSPGDVAETEISWPTSGVVTRGVS